MPNGADRNFVRFISCISGFKSIFNHWPSNIRIDPSFIQELEEVMEIQDYQKLCEKIALIPDNSNPWDGLYIAEDDEGNKYDLMKHGHKSGQSDVLEWLDIQWPEY